MTLTEAPDNCSFTQKKALEDVGFGTGRSLAGKTGGGEEVSGLKLPL